MNTHIVSNLHTVTENLTEKSVIELENVTIHYRVPRERVSGIKEYTIRWLQRRLRYEQFCAVDNLSLNIKRGEVFGVIGRNGSGKSTLLKVIARVLTPSQGRVILRGRVAPLLELGAGFHMELTGRENVYLNSALLGRPRSEVDLLLPEIIDFAEIGDFLEAPLRTYSTGMVARLGFAVATCVRPKILLVDEVLSVGDSRFQQKCLDRMYSFQAQGTTVVIVSHSMSTIESFCERAVWLNAGKAEALGSVSEVIRQYIHHMEGDSRERSPHPANSSETIETAGSMVKTSPSVENNTEDKVLSIDVTRDFVLLKDIEKVYPLQNIMNIQEGSIHVWFKFDISRTYQDAVIYHTDDSRFVLYVGSYYSSNQSRNIHLLVARAGGNRQVIDTYFGVSSYPELVIPLDQEECVPGSDFMDNRWRLFVMTWCGYPDGDLVVYLDGHLINQRSYDQRYDNGHPLAQTIAVGMRPSEWQGEILQDEDGTVKELRPESSLSVTNSNLEIRDLRVYQKALKHHEVQSLYLKRILADNA
jgi:ABC-type polysaccharide/polyol phosphate transport system ATPase subunit